MGQRRPLIDLIKAVKAGCPLKLNDALAAADKVVSRPPDARACQHFPLEHAPGLTLFRHHNDVGGYTYYSDEVGGGVFVWDTCLVDPRTLRAAIAVEERYGLPAPPLKPIPYDKLLCNASYLCWDPRRPGYVVGLWTDRWILLNHKMVFDEKVQRAARDCLVPCLDITEEPEV